MNLNDVHRGIHKNKTRKRLGRGIGSGHGKTAGRGHKGQGPAAGTSCSPIFRGRHDAAGAPHAQARFQQPLGRDAWPWSTSAISNDAFDAGDEVTPEALAAKNLVKGRYDELKMLGDGELTKKLKISAHRFSKSATEKIDEAGGEAIVLPGQAPVVKKARPQERSKRRQRSAIGRSMQRPTVIACGLALSRKRRCIP